MRVRCRYTLVPSRVALCLTWADDALQSPWHRGKEVGNGASIQYTCLRILPSPASTKDAYLLREGSVLLLLRARALQKHVGDDHQQDALKDEVPLVLQEVLGVQLTPRPEHIPCILCCLQANKPMLACLLQLCWATDIRLPGSIVPNQVTSCGWLPASRYPLLSSCMPYCKRSAMWLVAILLPPSETPLFGLSRQLWSLRTVTLLHTMWSLPVRCQRSGYV